MGFGTSRGAPEWSGGKDLYMESGFRGSGKSLVFSGIVPEGSRMFRKVPWWGPLVQDVPHGPRGDVLAHIGQAHQPPLVYADGIRG